MKKLILIIMMLALLVSCALAAEPELHTSGNWKYIILEDGTAQIRDYTGKDKELTIPSMIDGYAVTSIGDRAFEYYKSLRSVSIPDSVTSIGMNPFKECENLRNIRVSPEHPVLATIDGVLFYKPEKTLVTYPCGLSNSSYSIPQGITTIGASAFDHCLSLTSIGIPDSVTTIGDGAFYACKSLRSITIPDSVTFIDAYAFSWCESMTGISIPDGVTTIGARTFSYCKSLRSISIPDGVTSIGASAFDHCLSLSSISIPDSVTSIGDGVFTYCDALTTINVGRDSYAAQWCEENGLNYTYPDSLDWLNS